MTIMAFYKLDYYYFFIIMIVSLHTVLDGIGDCVMARHFVCLSVCLSQGHSLFIIH